MAQTVAQLGGSTVEAACVIDDQAVIAQNIAAGALRAADGTQQIVTDLDALTDATARAESAARGSSQDAISLAEQCVSVENSVREFVQGLLAA